MSTSLEKCMPKQGRRAKKGGAVAKAEPAESELKARRVRRAKLAMDPSVNAALVIEKFGDHFGDQDLAALTLELSDSKNEWLRGDAVCPSPCPASDFRECGDSGDGTGVV